MYIYIYMYTCMQKNDYICRRIFGSHKKKKKQFQDLNILPTSTRVFGWEQAWDLPTERNTK